MQEVLLSPNMSGYYYVNNSNSDSIMLFFYYFFSAIVTISFIALFAYALYVVVKYFIDVKNILSDTNKRLSRIEAYIEYHIKKNSELIDLDYLPLDSELVDELPSIEEESSDIEEHSSEKESGSSNLDDVSDN